MVISVGAELWGFSGHDRPLPSRLDDAMAQRADGSDGAGRLQWRDGGGPIVFVSVMTVTATRPGE